MTDPRHARIETMLSALLSAFARDIERAWRMGTDSEAVAKLEKETASRIFSALAESGADGRVRESAESLLRYINEAMDECPFCDMPDEQHDPDCRCGMLEAALSAPNPPVSSESSQPAEKAPTPMILHCPECRTRHIDEGDFATKVHHTHSCQGCGLTWRPAVVPTVGVQFLPGFKNEPAGANPPNSSNSSQPAEKADCPECHHAIARAVERAPLHDDGYIAQCEVCGKRHVRKREDCPGLSCECAAQSSGCSASHASPGQCGRTPAKPHMEVGWPDSIDMCETCAADAHKRQLEIVGLLRERKREPFEGANREPVRTLTDAKPSKPTEAQVREANGLKERPAEHTPPEPPRQTITESLSNNMKLIAMARKEPRAPGDCAFLMACHLHDAFVDLLAVLNERFGRREP